jgi:uncharacterized protein (TIGR03067 family)
MKTDVERLQGTWHVASLEVEGARMRDNAVKGSKIVLKGNTFETISMGAVYKGTFHVNPKATPKTLDMKFNEGPEKGNTSLGIYELDGDTWKICLTIGAKNRPKTFATRAGSGLGLEILKRELSGQAPEPPHADMGKQESIKNDYGERARLQEDVARLEGEWAMVWGEFAGQAFPEAFVKTAKRVGKGNRTTTSFGGQVMVDATISVDTSKKPKTIDYKIVAGPNQGKVQLGIYELDGDTFRSCFAPVGKDRPTEFATKAADERTLSIWKRVTR